MTTFYLGTHEPSWLKSGDSPLFVSHRRLGRLKVLPRASCRWALDSGGFSELSLFGGWCTTPAEYAAATRRYRDEVGGLDFAAIQDWMCEPFMVAKTGLSVREHQRRTVASYLELTALAPDLPWCPVLQGWEVPDYLDHAAEYERAGVDLGRLPRVGVGSVCRRQGTREAVELFADLAILKLRLHGFGLKAAFLRHAFHSGLESHDSMAWSYRARRSAPLPGCTHKSCANCRRFAESWRAEVCGVLDRPRMTRVFSGARS